MTWWNLPDEWSTKQLGNMVNVKSGFACAKKHLVTAEEGIAHLRPFNIDSRGHLDLSEVYYIPLDYKDNTEDYALKAGHVLFNNTNSVELVGKTALIKEPRKCTFSNHIYRLTVKPKMTDRLEPGWLALAIQQLWSMGYFAEYCTQWIGQAGFNSSKLAEVKVPLPYPDKPARSLKMQRQLIVFFAEVQSHIGKLQHSIDALTADLTRTERATLARLFRGEF